MKAMLWTGSVFCPIAALRGSLPSTIGCLSLSTKQNGHQMTTIHLFDSPKDINDDDLKMVKAELESIEAWSRSFQSDSQRARRFGRSSPSYQQQQYIAQLPDSFLTFGVVGLALSIDAEVFRCCLIGKQEEHSTPSNNSRTVSIELVTVAGSHCVYFLNHSYYNSSRVTRHAFLLLESI
jgi:hypothetical protein